MIDDHDAAALLAGMVTISRTFRKAGQRSRERSLAGTKYGFLRHLRETDARLGELAHQLVVSAPVASRAVEALEAENLVERHTDPADARAVLISITERGRARLSDAESRIIHKFADAFADWSAEDAEHAVGLLSDLNERLIVVLEPDEHSLPTDTDSHNRADEPTAASAEEEIENYA